MLSNMKKSPSKHFCYEYPRPAVSVDVVVVCKNKANELKILLIERGGDPFKGRWALPGGFMEMDETLEQAAARELQEETHLKVGRVEQVGMFSTVDRDPRGRVLSCGFLAILKRENTPTAMAGDDARRVDWYSTKRLPKLAFDHKKIIMAALNIMDGR